MNGPNAAPWSGPADGIAIQSPAHAPAADAPAPDFLSAAGEIASRICRDAIWSRDRCTWIAPSLEPVGTMWRPVYRAMQPDLYSGVAGVGLFLAHAAAATDEPIIRRTALGALRNAAARAHAVPQQARIALYSGAIGVAYALTVGGEVLAEDSLASQAIEIARAAATPDADLSGLDVLSGCAGAIQGLLWLSDHAGGEDWMLDAAGRMGDHLLATARRAGPGWSWDTMGGQPGMTTADLNGYSHGAAGIGLSLLELGTVTNQARFKEAAEQAFLYESRSFDPQAGNWPDFRDPAMGGMAPGPPADAPRAPNFMLAWCHGAPGIGLSRLRAWQLTRSPERLAEARAAIAGTARALEQPPLPYTSSSCLCHGECGNSELLLYAADVLDEPSYRAAAERIGARGLALYPGTHSPWPCGLQGCGELPGLMLGLAGIGLFYLRLHDRGETPPVVIIAPGDRRARAAVLGDMPVALHRHGPSSSGVVVALHNHGLSQGARTQGPSQDTV